MHQTTTQARAAQEQERETARAIPGLPPGYCRDPQGMDFSRTVADNGYLWWYLDAISDCSNYAMTMIVFVGSVFSPYYATARRRGPVSAEEHCAFNTILYGPRGRKRWSMTERGARHLRRAPDSYQLGPSRMDWDGTTLQAQIDERCVPVPTRMRGTITATPAALTPHCLTLDSDERHQWRPLAPVARVRVAFPGLGVHWEGDGYLDSNQGSEPLADGFRSWDWMRSRLADGGCAVRYEVREPSGPPRRLALRFAPDGNISSESTCPPAALPTTSLWRIPRQMPATDAPGQLLRTLEDTPFYARSIVATHVEGQRCQAFHESLSMRRFERPWVQRLLPFRMPRVR